MMSKNNSDMIIMFRRTCSVLTVNKLLFILQGEGSGFESAQFFGHPLLISTNGQSVPPLSNWNYTQNNSYLSDMTTYTTGAQVFHPRSGNDTHALTDDCFLYSSQQMQQIPGICENNFNLIKHSSTSIPETWGMNLLNSAMNKTSATVTENQYEIFTPEADEKMDVQLIFDKSSACHLYESIDETSDLEESEYLSQEMNDARVVSDRPMNKVDLFDDGHSTSSKSEETNLRNFTGQEEVTECTDEENYNELVDEMLESFEKRSRLDPVTVHEEEEQEKQSLISDQNPVVEKTRFVLDDLDSVPDRDAEEVQLRAKLLMSLARRQRQNITDIMSPAKNKESIVSKVNADDDDCMKLLFLFLETALCCNLNIGGLGMWTVERKSGCRNVVVAGVRCAGRGRKTWRECVTWRE